MQKTSFSYDSIEYYKKTPVLVINSSTAIAHKFMITLVIYQCNKNAYIQEKKFVLSDSERNCVFCQKPMVTLHHEFMKKKQNFC